MAIGVYWVKNSAENVLLLLFYFSQKTGFDISCKLSPNETICMKCQKPVFWEKQEKLFFFILAC